MPKTHRVVNVEPFHKNLGDMLLAAERCLRLQQHLPALVLIYALIDSLAWSAAERTQKSVRRRFEAWVTRWLMPHLAPVAPGVTPTDLYAARCGVLHSLTGRSDLSQGGQAKQVMYAWGTADPKVLRAAIADSPMSNHVALHYDELFTALCRSVEVFLESANKDAALAERLEEAAGQHYLNIPVESVHDESGT